MGFIYTKPLSIEGIFAKFDTDGDGKISADEKKAAKGMDVFTSFKINKGMTLEKFESKNRDTYARYEQASTLAYNRQQEQVQQWIKYGQEAMLEHKEYELKELERLEQELEKEKEELELKLAKRKEETD